MASLALSSAVDTSSAPSHPSRWSTIPAFKTIRSYAGPFWPWRAPKPNSIFLETYYQEKKKKTKCIIMQGLWERKKKGCRSLEEREASVHQSIMWWRFVCWTWNEDLCVWFSAAAAGIGLPCQGAVWWVDSLSIHVERERDTYRIIKPGLMQFFS